MKTGKRWTRNELLIVLNLYHKLRFGQYDQRQIVVRELAQKLGRTPSSVAMKLSNLASLDPVLKLRGIEGLSGASSLDREVWEEFQSDLATMTEQSQIAFDQLFTSQPNETTEVIPGKGIVVNDLVEEGTETSAWITVRRKQKIFRQMVLNNYDSKCAITGLPIRELLVASHILPWAKHEKERLNVRNGIALNALQDAAFDRHMISFDDNLCLMVSKAIRAFLPHAMVESAFMVYTGQSIQLPTDAILPDPKFLALHRKNFELKANN
jgi:putative restriction endonuclease